MFKILIITLQHHSIHSCNAVTNIVELDNLSAARAAVKNINIKNFSKCLRDVSVIAHPINFTE